MAVKKIMKLTPGVSENGDHPSREQNAAVTGKRYPIRTLADMAAIPGDVLPRFLAELPLILRAMRQMDMAADDLAAEARPKAPWFLRWAVTGALMRNSIKRNAGTWVDDGKATATVRMAAKRGAEPFWTRRESLHDPR